MWVGFKGKVKVVKGGGSRQEKDKEKDNRLMNDMNMKKIESGVLQILTGQL